MRINNKIFFFDFLMFRFCEMQKNYLFAYLELLVSNNKIPILQSAKLESAMHSQSSLFQPVLLKSVFLSELEAFTEQLIDKKEKILLSESKQQNQLSHPLAQLLLNIITNLYKALGKNDQLDADALLNVISYKLLKNIGTMVDEQLIVFSSEFQREICKVILFKQYFNEVLKRFCSPNSSNTQQIHLIELKNIFSALSEPNFKERCVENLYSMLGGSPICLERKAFEESLYCILWSLGIYFINKNNFIIDNVNRLKKNNNVHELLNHSVRFICNFQNQPFLEIEIKKLSSFFFTSPIIHKHEYLEKIEKLDKNSSLSHLLWVFVDILKAESIIMQDQIVKEQIENQKKVASSNFYEHQMQKLFKKCPYNGDECCSCKKCQCVRRNRESAKLSQQKKRNAVVQLDPLNKRIQQLEKRNKELEEQNSILKDIFSEIKHYEAFQSIFSSTLDPINKVLND